MWEWEISMAWCTLKRWMNAYICKAKKLLFFACLSSLTCCSVLFFCFQCRCVVNMKPKIRFNKPDAANYWCCDINFDSFFSLHTFPSLSHSHFLHQKIEIQHRHCRHKKLELRQKREWVSFFYYWTMNIQLQVSLTKCSFITNKTIASWSGPGMGYVFKQQKLLEKSMM